MSKPIQMERGVKYRDADKMALIPVKTVVTERQAACGFQSNPGHQGGDAQKRAALGMRRGLLP